VSIGSVRGRFAMGARWNWAIWAALPSQSTFNTFIFRPAMPASCSSECHALRWTLISTSDDLISFAGVHDRVAVVAVGRHIISAT
jgi:hypothetical protein